MVLVLLGACGTSSANETTTTGDGARLIADWEAGANRGFGRVDVYDRWTQLEATSPSGARARTRLNRADEHYREAIRLLRADQPHVLDEFRKGLELAPMDPELYFPLAEACRSRGLVDRAGEYYRKYLVLRPDGPNTEAARETLRTLPGDLLIPRTDGGTEDLAVNRAPNDGASNQERVSPFDVALGGLAGASLTLALLLLVWALRRRGLSLARLAQTSPELHPAIAYLVGSLRHELLKHRIGALGDAARSIQAGSASRDETAFLQKRLFGGEPLLSAWDAHVDAFGRALGYRLNLNRDPFFRQAGRTFRRLSSLAGELNAPSERTGERLVRAHRSLRAFDSHLARLSNSLVRTRVDHELLTELAEDVAGEYTPSQVKLAELRVEVPEETIEIEVFRVDLVLILKNVLRNAILAVGRGNPPRMVELRVDVDLEPTGQEVVWILVSDTSDETITTQSLYDRRVDRGLGLVTAALSRYDGTMEVRPGSAPFQKSIGVRFFRMFDDLNEDS